MSRKSSFVNFRHNIIVYYVYLIVTVARTLPSPHNVGLRGVVFNRLWYIPYKDVTAEEKDDLKPSQDKRGFSVWPIKTESKNQKHQFVHPMFNVTNVSSISNPTTLTYRTVHHWGTEGTVITLSPVFHKFNGSFPTKSERQHSKKNFLVVLIEKVKHMLQRTFKQYSSN